MKRFNVVSNDKYDMEEAADGMWVLFDDIPQAAPVVQTLTDEQIDAVFMQHAGRNEWGLPYLRTYREGFRHIARAVLAAAATPPAVQAPAEPHPTRADLVAALKFYAEGGHFNLSDDSAWDTVSGEPQNWWCDEPGTATIEDGTIAKRTLSGDLTAADIAAMDEDGAAAQGGEHV